MRAISGLYVFHPLQTMCLQHEPQTLPTLTAQCRPPVADPALENSAISKGFKSSKLAICEPGFGVTIFKYHPGFQRLSPPKPHHNLESSQNAAFVHVRRLYLNTQHVNRKVITVSINRYRSSGFLHNPAVLRLNLVLGPL